MTKASARELGLSTGRRVRIGSKTVTRTRWVGKGKNRRKVVRKVQTPVYKTLDERYVPARAIPAMARRVANRRAWLGGKLDFAIAEYHMGAGRMAKLLSAYFGQTIKVSEVTAQMSSSGLTYEGLYWTNTPYFREDVYEALEDLNDVDYSPTYCFRVRQAMRLLSTYRESPEEYARLASAYEGKFGWAVLPSWQWSFVTEPLTSALPAPPPTGVLHQDASERFTLWPDIATTFGVRAGSTALSAERSTIGSALFVAQQLRRLQGDRYKGFEITRMLAPSAAGCTDAGYDGDENDECAPLHTMGWAFDIASNDLSRTDRRDLKFILTDLRQAGLLAYLEGGKEPTWHVVRHPDHAARFEQFYWDTLAGSTPAEDRRVAYRFSEPEVVTVTASLDNGARDPGTSRLPGVFVALSSLFARIYGYFS
jgi:hypothetical protein